VLNAKDAALRGAVVRVGHRLVGAVREGGRWQATVENQASKQKFTVSARAIANAAGPWVAQVLTDRLAGSSAHAVRLIKGSHIVVRRLYEGDHAYVLQHPDRRIVFVIPYQNDFTLIGTTDIPWQGEPGPMSITAAETEYLCATVNAYFRRPISPADVVWSYSGVRPLFDDDASDASAVTRDYVLDVEAPAGEAAVLSVFGGKITTYRRLAEHALDKLAPHLGPMAAPWTGSAPLPGGDIANGDMESFVNGVQDRWPFLSTAQAWRLARAYGTRIAALLGEIESCGEMGEDFGGGLTRLEVDFLMDEEWARSVEDLYWRHSKAGLYASPEDERRLAAYLNSKRVAADRVAADRVAADGPAARAG